MAKYGMSKVDSAGAGLFAVTKWQEGRCIGVAYLPLSPRLEDLARDFCAKQNTTPHGQEERERAFIAWAARYRRMTITDKELER